MNKIGMVQAYKMIEYPYKAFPTDIDSNFYIRFRRVLSVVSCLRFKVLEVLYYG